MQLLEDGVNLFIFFFFLNVQLAACCSLLDFFLKLYFCHYWKNNQDKRRGTRSGKDLEQRFKLKQYLTTCQGYISDLILEWETILSLDSDISAPLNELPLACCITLHVMALISDLLNLFFHYIKIIWLVFVFFTRQPDSPCLSKW